MIITFFVSGIWHGANWTFIFWGILNGIYQVIGEIKKPIVNKFNQKFKVNIECFSYKLGQVSITFFLTTVAWIFFRSNSIKDGIIYIYRMFTKWDLWQIVQIRYFEWGLDYLEFTIAVLGICILFLVDLIKYKKKQDLVAFLNMQNLWFRWGIYILLFFSIIVFGIYGPGVDASQFIYF